jgi:hypothetical protein
MSAYDSTDMADGMTIQELWDTQDDLGIPRSPAHDLPFPGMGLDWLPEIDEDGNQVWPLSRADKVSWWLTESYWAGVVAYRCSKALLRRLVAR